MDIPMLADQQKTTFVSCADTATWWKKPLLILSEIIFKQDEQDILGNAGGVKRNS